MPLIRRNYLNLTREQRLEGAKAARSRLQSAMSSPGITSEQLFQLQQEIARLDRWVEGSLHVVPDQQHQADVRSNLLERMQGSTAK